MSTTKRIVTKGAMTAILLVAGSTAWASSHREAPGITETPKVDGTDFYMFRSFAPDREDYVTLIANYLPDQTPGNGPNYFTLDPDAIYEIMIDNDGDAVEDITFQFAFNNNLSANGAGFSLPIGGVDVAIPLRHFGGISADDRQTFLNENESYTVTMITGDRRSGARAQLTMPDGGGSFEKPVDNIGDKTFEDYEEYADTLIYDNVTIPNCDTTGRVFVGQREEAFAVNLGQIFDLVNLVPLQGADNPDYPEYNVGDGAFPGGITQDRDNDDLIGRKNVTSLALEIPISCLTEGDDPVIGGWTTASLPQAQLEDPSPTYEATSEFGGAWVQQSRVSSPLVNEIVIGLPDKDLFNAAEPIQDSALATYVTNPTFPALLDILFNEAVNTTLGADIDNLAPSNFPRNDLVAAFLTGFTGFNASSNPDAVAAEMLRLNTAVPPTAIEDINPFGVVAEDLAGFPNGRRPTDDVVDIELRVAMGALCHPVPLGAELGVEGAEEGEESDLINLGFCTPEQAPVGSAAFTDGAPKDPEELRNSFPYLNTPLPGASTEG